ncbi:MAG: hypothetical protein COA78_16985 [Blastopirellula sp.]|nr:MAG: hypothetical protein COA78_16985 [Blastopirellula sp.]
MTSSLIKLPAYTLLAVIVMVFANKETVLAAPPNEPSTWGKLTATENLIRLEILRLDGDWESGSKPKLVGFLGQRFKSPHFEMLTHLPSTEWFSAQYCTEVDNFAIKCISSIISLKRLDFVGCEINTTCMSLLQSNRELRQLLIEDSQLSDSAFDGITQLSQVEILWLDDADLSEVSDISLEHMSRMSSLKECSLSGCTGMTAERFEKLKTALPNVKWSGLGRIQRELEGRK